MSADGEACVPNVIFKLSSTQHTVITDRQKTKNLFYLRKCVWVFWAGQIRIFLSTPGVVCKCVSV